MAITKKTPSPFIVELQTDPTVNQGAREYREYAEDAGRVTVFTGQTEDTAATSTLLIGSGLNAALNTVAAGGTYVTDPTKGAWTGSTIEINAESTDTYLVGITVKNAVYGGALAQTAKGKLNNKFVDGVSAVVNGDVSLTLQNTNAKTVYGGGGGYGAEVNGNVSIVYGGGNISRIYGGGATGSIVNGDVTIVINANTTGRIGTIYAGGQNSTVNGNAKVVINGGVGNFKVGTVSGAGYGKKSSLSGNSTLEFSNYGGNFSAVIRDFDTVVFDGSTSVTLSKGQNATMRGATYKFVINQDTFGLQGAMLTWNAKALYSDIVVSVETSVAIDVVLIQSKTFKTASNFNINTVLVVNGNGEKLSSYAYTLTYNYDKKLGGSVSISYHGTNLVFDGTEDDKVILSGSNDDVNVVAGGNLVGGLDVGGGNNVIRLQRGAEVHGGIQAGDGDDTLYIQKDVLLTGEVSMGAGNDNVYIEDSAEVTSNISLGSGVNTLTLQKGAAMTGAIIFSGDSVNTVTVNGAVMDFIGGDETTYNTIALYGDTVNGGGVGYWANGLFVVRDLNLYGEAHDTVILGNGAYVNNIFLGGGNDKLIVNTGARIGYDYAGGNTIPATVNLGTGKDVLVLNTQLGDNVNVLTADDGGDVIVIGADMAINDNQLLVGSTNNTLVVANGRQVTFSGVLSLGSFLSGDNKYEAIYLSRNAVLNVDGDSLIQNYTGTLVREDGTIRVNGAPAEAPAEILPYYTAGDGVTGSKLYAKVIDLESGAKITGSELIGQNIFAHDGTAIDNSAAGFVAVEDYLLVGKAASVSGMIYLGTEPIRGTSSAGARADVGGTVEAIKGGAGDDRVNIVSDSAKIGSIDLGGGANTVAFSSGTFTDEALVIARTGLIIVGDDSAITVGSAAGYASVELGLNSTFTEVLDRTVSVGDWNKAINFSDGYTVNLYGAIDADVTLTNNTVRVLDGENGYFAREIALVGENTISLAKDVVTWYDWQQFTGEKDKLTFQLDSGAFFAVDGFVSEDDAVEIKANTVLSANAALGLGAQIYIRDWNGAFDIDNIPDVVEGRSGILAWNNLEVQAGGKIWGGLFLNDSDNAVLINDGVVVNGSTYDYDFAAIDTGAGNDTLIIGEATVNGKITVGGGDNTLVIDGATVNRAINQSVGVLEVGDDDSQNDITIENTALNGDVRFYGMTGGKVKSSTIAGDLAFGDGPDDVLLSDVTVGGDVDFGNGYDKATLDKVSVGGDVVLNGGEFGFFNGTVIGGDVDFAGGFTELTAGNTEVAGNLLFNARSNVLKVQGALSANGIINDGSTEINQILVSEDGELTLSAGDINLSATENLIDVAGGAINMNGNIFLAGRLNEVVLKDGGSLNGLDELVMSGSTLNRILASESVFVAGSVQMGAEENAVSAINGSIDIAGNLELNGNENTIGSLNGLVAVGGNVTLSGFSNSIFDNGGSADANGIAVKGAVKFNGTSNNIDSSTAFTAASVEMSGAVNKVTTAGAFELTGNSELDGNLSGNLAMVGDENTVNVTGGTLIADAVLQGGAVNTFTNAGEVTLAGTTLTGETYEFTGVGLVQGGSDSVNRIVNTETGVITAANILVGGANSVNSITNDGSFTAREVTLGVSTLGAASNLVVNNGTMAVEALSLILAENKIVTGVESTLTSEKGILMVGETNFIDAFHGYKASYDTNVESNMVTTPVIDIKINADVTMNGTENEIDLGFQATADGAIKNPDGYPVVPAIDLPAVAQVSDVTVVMNGKIDMEGASNYAEIAYFLVSDQEGDIVVNGDAVIATGDITMRGTENTVYGWIYFAALNEGAVELNNHNITISMGDISMDTDPIDGINRAEEKTNDIWVGYSFTDHYEGWPQSWGEIRNAGTLKVTAGDIVMLGAGAKNVLEIGDKGTVGSITMGSTKGDQVSLSNELWLYEGGTINGEIVGMIAETNTINFLGSGSLTEWMDVAGGVNNVTIGKDFRVNDVVSFGGIYDQDRIGTEGYLLIPNTENNVTVEGYVGGIDTSVSNGSTELNNSKDTIVVSNGGEVGGDILTGLGDDSVTLDSGTVTGSVTMGVELFLAAGVDENVFPAYESQKSFSANFSTVGKDVTMYGEDNTAEVKASEIGGDLLMVASNDNTVTIGVGRQEERDADDNLISFVEKASKVTGNVTLISNDDNELTVRASEIGGDLTLTARDNNRVFIGSYNFETGSGPLGKAPVGETRGSKITGNVTMNVKEDDNTLRVYSSEVGGDISMTSLAKDENGEAIGGGDNFVRISGSTTGSLNMEAYDDNRARVSGSTVGAITMQAYDNNRLGVYAKEVDGVKHGSTVMGDISQQSLTGDNTLHVEDSVIDGKIIMAAYSGSNEADIRNSITGAIGMIAGFAEDAVDSSNTLELSGELVYTVGFTPEAPVVNRTTVLGDLTMLSRSSNDLQIGKEDCGETSLENFGSVTITGALVLASLTNTVTVWAGTQTSFTDGPWNGTELDLRALVGSVEMNGKENSLTVNQGVLGVTDTEDIDSNGIELDNRIGDEEGSVIAGATNTITVAASSMLILNEVGEGQRKAISLGNASVSYGSINTSGSYGDVDNTYVTRDSSGYETYHYDWKDTSTTDPDTAAATEANTVVVSGKLRGGDLTLTGRTNTVVVSGPATQDPQQTDLEGDYPFYVAEVGVGDVKLSGDINTVRVTSSADGYDAAFAARSVTMGDIVVDYSDKSVKILASANKLEVSENGFINVGDVSQTATTSNIVSIGGFTRLIEEEASDLLAGGNKLVAAAGNASLINPYIKENDGTTNTLGDIVMTATGVADSDGDVITDGTNTLSLGTNSEASDVMLTGYTNTVTLGGDVQATYYAVDASTGTAVMDGIEQKIETVTLQNAAKINDLVFGLPEDMFGEAPTNTLTMGAGSQAASITSTDTFTLSGDTAGAVDTISMGIRAAVTGNVSLGYGNDSVTMGEDAEIGGELNLGAGADTLTTTGDAEIGTLTFGLGADALVMGGDLSLGALTYSGTLTASGSGTVEVDSAVTFATALTTVSTVVWDVETLTISTTVTGKLALSDADNDVTLTSATLGDFDLGDGDDTITSTGNVTVGTVTANDLTISGGTLTYTAFDIDDDLTVDGAIAFVGSGSSFTVDGVLTLDLSSLSASGVLMTFSGTNSWDELSDGDFAMELDSNILTEGEYLDLFSGFAVDLSSWNMDGSGLLSDISLKIGTTVISDFTYDSVNGWALGTNGADTWKLSVEGGSTLRLTFGDIA